MKLFFLILFLPACFVQGQNLVLNPDIMNDTGYCRAAWQMGWNSIICPCKYPEQKGRSDTKMYSPWSDLSCVNISGECRDGKLIRSEFEFQVLEETANNNRYIQGQFCHILKPSVSYRLGFNLRPRYMDSKYLRNCILYINISDSFVSNPHKSRLKAYTFQLSDSSHDNSSFDISIPFKANGDEQYFQVWLVNKQLKENKYYYFKDFYLYSDTDTSCAGTTGIAETNTSKLLSLNSELLFTLNSADLSEAGKTALRRATDSIAGIMHLIRRISITGYTDSTGNADYNLLLSRKRAEAVEAFLKSEGISAAEWQVKGEGESKLLYLLPGEGYKNRRVEIVIEN